MWIDNINAYRDEINQCFNELSVSTLNFIVQTFLIARMRDNNIFILGNGGSAATASHMAVDLSKASQAKKFRAISLTDSAAMITATANDQNYSDIFREQLIMLMKPQDIVVAISASGNSANVLSAVKYANKNKGVTIGFIGFGGGELKDLVSVNVTVSSRNYGVVEDFHLSLNHMISQHLAKYLNYNEGA